MGPLSICLNHPSLNIRATQNAFDSHDQGMARVDGFLLHNDQFVINELNTIPGFTNISMYPKMWEVSRMTSTQLIDRLIQLALHA